VGDAENRWTRVIKAFEHVVILVLMGLLMVVVAISTVELGWLLVRDLSSIRTLMLESEEMFELFGFFLVVLIGLELVTSLKSYVRKGVVQVEVVLEVALIAVAQKLIILDSTKAGGPTLLGVAGLVLSLAVAFWLVRTAHQRGASTPDRPAEVQNSQPPTGSE
jgi:uncharacterized membrane protein (DUF373 family)